MGLWTKFMRIFRETKSSSDRTFGLAMAAFSLVLVAHQWVKWRYLNLPFLALSVAFVATALIFPKSLHLLNRAWTFLGLAIGFFVSPIVLGFIYWGIFTPFAIGSRFFRGDTLKLRWEKDKESYWIERLDFDPAPERFKNQF
jgi:polyferredoxin